MTFAGLSLRCRTFRVPRRDHLVEECEDAVALDPARGRFAIADGASESAHSGLWARLLVEGFVTWPDEQVPWPGWLTPMQHQWATAVRRPADAEPLPWFLEGRYRDGAYATFLGLWFHGPRWHALAVGDSCLFLVRKNRLELSFPLTHAGQFDNTPWLIGSRASLDEVPRQRALYHDGDVRPGDRLFLMTDALARWFLATAETGAQPWLPLDVLIAHPDNTFADWVARLRTDRQLRNDDTTLIAITL